MSLPLRSAPSGPAFVGENQNDTLLWDTATGGWTVGTVPAGGVLSVFGRTGAVVAVTGDYDSDQIDNVSNVAGSSVSDALDELETLTGVPLAAVRYCDVNTTVLTADQDGSIARPFASIQDAFDSLSAVSGLFCAVLLAPGDYTAETGLVFQHALALQLSALEIVSRTWQSSSGPQIADLNYSGAVNLKLNGIQHGDIDAGTASLSLENCSANTSSMGSSGGVISMFNCFYGATTVATGSYVRIRACEIRGLDVTVTGGFIDVTETEWTVSGLAAFSGAPGVLRMDPSTQFYWAAMAGSAVLTNGSIQQLALTALYGMTLVNAAIVVASNANDDFIPSNGGPGDFALSPTGGLFALGNFGLLTYTGPTQRALVSVAVTLDSTNLASLGLVVALNGDVAGLNQLAAATLAAGAVLNTCVAASRCQLKTERVVTIATGDTIRALYSAVFPATTNDLAINGYSMSITLLGAQ